MFNSVSSLSERLKAVAQAGVDSFDSVHKTSTSPTNTTGKSSSHSIPSDALSLPDESSAGLERTSSRSQSGAASSNGSNAGLGLPHVSLPNLNGLFGNAASGQNAGGKSRIGMNGEIQVDTGKASLDEGTDRGGSGSRGSTTHSPLNAGKAVTSPASPTSNRLASRLSSLMASSSSPSPTATKQAPTLQDRLREAAQRKSSTGSSVNGPKDGTESSRPSLDVPRDRAGESVNSSLKEPADIPLPPSPELPPHKNAVPASVTHPVHPVPSSDSLASQTSSLSEELTTSTEKDFVLRETPASPIPLASPPIAMASSLFNTPRNRFPMASPQTLKAGESSKSALSTANPSITEDVKPTAVMPELVMPKATLAESEGREVAAEPDTATPEKADNGTATVPYSSSTELDNEMSKTEAMLAAEDALEKIDGQVKTDSTQEALDVSNGSKTDTVPLPKSSDKLSELDSILKSASPMLSAGIDDLQALDEWLKMVNGKLKMSSDEIKRLSEQLSLQDSRLEEVREVHRLESVSTNALVQQLRDQLSKSEVNLSSQASQALQIAQLKAELTTTQTKAKEEEEKRTKAINLLKTVRTKLVKVEREKAEAEKSKEEDRVDRLKLVENVERLRAEREKEVQNLRSGFEKEVKSLKEKYERDMLTKRREWELEVITTKAAHAKELGAKSKTISSLNDQIRELNEEKLRQFNELQTRQDQLESAMAARESFETRMKELQYQLREVMDRATAAEEALAGQDRSLAGNERVISPVQTPDVSTIISTTTSKYENQISELREQIARQERERLELDEEHARQLRARNSELEKLRRLMDERLLQQEDIARSKQLSDERIAEIEKAKSLLQLEVQQAKEEIRQMRQDQFMKEEAEAAAREDRVSKDAKTDELRQQLEEAKQAVMQQKAANRTLREESRRLQASIQLMERQRNPGVGYWAANGKSKPAENSAEVGKVSLDLDRQSPAPRPASPRPSENGSVKDEEEVNLEYLRNVILQFLEHKEMRPNLVRVLSVILRFTPQELRRLESKLAS